MSARSAAAAWEGLFRAQVSAMRRFEAGKDFAPLRSKEYDVLFNLAQMGGSARQGELNERLLISQPSLSRMIERLVAAGHLQRQECDSDGRGVVVGLTGQGAELQRTIGRRHVRHIAEIIDDALTEDEQHALIELTDKIRASAAQRPRGAGQRRGTRLADRAEPVGVQVGAAGDRDEVRTGGMTR